ncbi:hypothetical protein E2C01_045415 [Portunus trituberculatus]|uniref:Uncharacterized protein n=1 Tax=Portunus trituberculatus TaxID=210409 RepID=A0A5B7G160_PORTR|nr:hypothetical protein [Portunus trituberculatus]
MAASKLTPIVVNILWSEYDSDRGAGQRELRDGERRTSQGQEARILAAVVVVVVVEEKEREQEKDDEKKK